MIMASRWPLRAHQGWADVVPWHGTTVLIDRGFESINFEVVNSTCPSLHLHPKSKVQWASIRGGGRSKGLGPGGDFVDPTPLGLFGGVSSGSILTEHHIPVWIFCHWPREQVDLQLLDIFCLNEPEASGGARWVEQPSHQRPHRARDTSLAISWCSASSSGHTQWSWTCPTWPRSHLESYQHPKVRELKFSCLFHTSIFQFQIRVELYFLFCLVANCFYFWRYYWTNCLKSLNDLII